MKKCPYCAEEIQEDAILCRYCKQSLLPNNNQLPQPEEDKTTRKKPWSVFLLALLFGLSIGTSLFFYNFRQPVEFPEYGDSGHFNDAVLKGLTSIFFYGFLFSMIMWIWRSFIKRAKGIKVFSKETGFQSMVIFIILFLIINFLIIYSPDFKLSQLNLLITPTSMSNGIATEDSQYVYERAKVVRWLNDYSLLSLRHKNYKDELIKSIENLKNAEPTESEYARIAASGYYLRKIADEVKGLNPPKILLSFHLTTLLCYDSYASYSENMTKYFSDTESDFYLKRAIDDYEKIKKSCLDASIEYVSLVEKYSIKCSGSICQ